MVFAISGNAHLNDDIYLFFRTLKCIDRFFIAAPESRTKIADFEAAISATGYGRFNLLLMAVGFLCCTGSMADTTVVAYILPRAECDLDLTMSDKGALNANTYVGMILSAILWGFLADVLGRRNILMYGYLLTGFFNFLGGLSQNFWSLIIAKFCSGFMWVICLF